MATFIIFLAIVLIVIVMYGNEIFRGSFKVKVVRFLPLGIFKEDKNKDSTRDNGEESTKEQHINKEIDTLHNSISDENDNDLKENEIEVKEIESDERNVEIHEKEEEKTCIESEYSNVSDLIEENDDDVLKEEKIVYWTPNGKTYHSKSTCRTLTRSKVINSGTVSDSGKDFKCENCK